MVREVHLGHSPDSDDAFMFYALLHGKLDPGGLSISHRAEGIESLNQRARRGELEVTALSFAAYPLVAERYALLRAGASLGLDCGPLVVSARPLAAEALSRVTVAIPGELTSAFLALRLCVGPVDFAVVPFDQIIPQVRAGRFAAGLLIHEGQLTYQAEGLHPVLDLLRWWQEHTGGLPLPLGANAVRRDLGQETAELIGGLIRRSVEWAMAHREEALAYALGFARGIDGALTDRFIGHYVNEYTLELGELGRRAVERFLAEGHEQGLLPALPGPLFPER